MRSTSAAATSARRSRRGWTWCASSACWSARCRPGFPTQQSPCRCVASSPAEEVGVLRLSALRGLFSAVIEDQVTFVNAPSLASERGVEASIEHGTGEPQPPQRRRRPRRGGRRFDGQRRRHAVRPPIGPEDRSDQRTQPRSARRGREPDHQLPRPAGALGTIGARLGGAGINILAAQLSQDADGGGRRHAAAGPLRFLPRCWRYSARTSGGRWNWWTCREVGRDRRRRHRSRGHRRGPQGARRRAPASNALPTTWAPGAITPPVR